MDERTLIDAELIEQASDQLEALPKGKRPPVLEHEPYFRGLIEDNFKRIAGRLVMNGAPTPLIRHVMHEVDHTLALALSALHLAYRGILIDIIPDDPADDGVNIPRTKKSGSTPDPACGADFDNDLDNDAEIPA
jgi:hypothetical protein